jgi:hypothetical protein
MENKNNRICLCCVKGLSSDNCDSIDKCIVTELGVTEQVIFDYCCSVNANFILRV